MTAKKYLLRMYFFGLGMGLIDVICNNIVADLYAMISNNIFVTLFFGGGNCLAHRNQKNR
jgi:hypothetical protein